MNKPWMQYGTEKYVLGTSEFPPGVTIVDVAAALAKLNRFTGHSIQPLSVARHSLYVANLAREDGHSALLQLYALLHDAQETVVNDLSAPLKEALGPEGLAAYSVLEGNAEAAVFKLAGVAWPMPTPTRSIVKRYDIEAVVAERECLMPPCAAQWRHRLTDEFFTPASPTRDWKYDMIDWLNRYRELKWILHV